MAKDLAVTKHPSGKEWCLDLPDRRTKANGTWRSLNGAAAESLVIGWALAAGFILFVKAWRDTKYDAVLDHEGRLYRLEIKFCSDGKLLNVTNGGRSGKQINRAAPSRRKIVSTQDCDVLVGVQLGTGRCWIIPVEVIEILGRQQLNPYGLENFEEAWELFIIAEKYLGKDGMRTCLRKWNKKDLRKVRKALGINGKIPWEHQVSPKGWHTFSDDKDRRVFQIWQKLAEMGRP